MATIQWMVNEADNFINVIKHWGRQAEKRRIEEYQSARKIQCWLRYVRNRSSMIVMTQSAIIIQASWRSFLARQIFRKRLQAKYQSMCLAHYDLHATAVQTIWRGYISRKVVFDYYRLKKFCRDAVAQNQIQMEAAEAYRPLPTSESQARRVPPRKEHHLLRTFHIPGIYSLRASRVLSELEKRLKSHKFYFRHIQRRPSPPPPPYTKSQGPFQPVHEVQKQRNKAFRPTLAMQVPYNNQVMAQKEEKDREWALRLHDDRFICGVLAREKYDRLISTQGKYGLPKYGRLYFREPADPSKKMSPQDFKSQVPHISLFELLNTEYPGYPLRKGF